MNAPSLTPAGRRRFPHSFGVQIVAAMILGLILGLVARAIGPGPAGAPNGLAQALDLTGAIFVQLLKALVPPLIFTAIVASIANLAELANAARLVWRTLLWFAITAAIAVSIGIALGLILQPGLHHGAGLVAEPPPRTVGSWLDFLKGVVPGNFLGLQATTKLADGAATTVLGFNVLQLVVVSIVVGVAALRVGAAGEPFLGFIRSASAIVRRILKWVIALTPIGTIGLFGTAIAQYGWDALSSLGQFVLAVYLGLGLVLLVVYPAILLLNGLDPRRFFAAAWPVGSPGTELEFAL